jgi:hypothetical protein
VDHPLTAVRDEIEASSVTLEREALGLRGLYRCPQHPDEWIEPATARDLNQLETPSDDYLA